METKLCRICGKLGQNFVNIFNAEGLKSKIETCLPITVSPYCLLPDTICNKCNEDVNNFHNFIKHCLQNIIVLEAQYNVQESCLKSKQRHDKGCVTDFIHTKSNKSMQTEDFLDVLTGNHFDLEQFAEDFPFTTNFLRNQSTKVRLVEYEDTSSEEDMPDSVIVNESHFDIHSDSIIKEISQRKASKRKSDSIQRFPVKICKFEQGNKRKSRVPKKIDFNNSDAHLSEHEANLMPVENNAFVNKKYLQQKQFSNCSLCDKSVPGSEALNSHVFETHGIDLTDVVSSGSEKSKKKLPNLVKISDLKRTDSNDDNHYLETQIEEPPTLLPTFVCSNCPAIFTVKSELTSHIRNEHSQLAAYLCGLCSHQCNSYVDLKGHVQTCSQKYQFDKRYVCQICYYGEDNSKSLENHVLIHDFLLEFCKKQSKIFDPANYIESNKNFEIRSSLMCSECSCKFESFKEFSAHRRIEHSIYHCDLCSKFYGRNSHLWKHVNRLHKGHPSITCQLCYKTSASKYHLAQHFNKIHFAKRKFQYFDFPSNTILNDQENTTTTLNEETLAAPKEIDSTHDLYNNIITNYTPPSNEGDFKCLKCSKGFHKKVLLKKHKKNCRPKMQKDLLTRCKTCSRVFKDRQSLAKHLVNYHSDYTCEICNQNVQSKCEIVSHIRFQHPSCNLFCKMCKNILRSNADMELHIRDHAFSYICQFCGDSLSDKIKLKMHILSLHRKILSLSCGICLKLFENQHKLKDHVTLVHKDQFAPFTTCPVCGKNYGSKWKTYDHFNKCHGSIFKVCKTCLEVFNNETQLQAHCDVTNHGSQNVGILKNNTVMCNFDIKEENEEIDESSDEIEGNGNEESSDDQSSEDKDRTSLLEKTLLDKPTTNGCAKKKKKENDSGQVNSSKRTVYVNSNDPSCCEICFKTWPAKKHLWQHYIRCHKKVAATVCGICLKTNNSYESLQVHLKENHPTLLYGQGFGSNFICKICGRYHNASSKLRLHMVIHENFNWEMLEDVKKVIKKEAEDEEIAINYESLIEQVECSSPSDNEEDGTINGSKDKIEDEGDDEDDSSSDQDDSDDSLRYENSVVKVETDSSTDNSNSSSYSDNSSQDSNLANDQHCSNSNTTTTTGTTTNDSLFNGNAFKHGSEELDTAIKSISYEGAEEMNVDKLDEYYEIENDNEIESAVGSIL